MLVEAIAITAILIVMILVFVRAGKKHYAIASSTLVVFPAVVVLTTVVKELFPKLITLNVTGLIYIIGLAIAFLLIGIASQIIKEKRSKIMYIVIAASFEFALGLIYLYNLY
ncbi:MAG: hypothetical protein RSA79_01210 [Oscillospiraceae bacterium]